jgi:hypothetical protein
MQRVGIVERQPTQPQPLSLENDYLAVAEDRISLIVVTLI